jgi:hypothetical protein
VRVHRIGTPRKLEKALRDYDEAVLPMTTNAGCAFTCPSRAFYISVSRINKGDHEQPFVCSQ